MKKFRNIPFVLFGFIVLIAGVFGGLSRLGVNFIHIHELSAFHGPLMVSGFLGIVISLERAVALGKFWGFLSPFFGILGGLGLLSGFLSLKFAGMLFSVSGLILSGIFFDFLRKHRDDNLIFMTVGSLFLVFGNISIFFENPISSSVKFWVAFLLFTIIAERLELSSFLVRSQIQILILRLLLFFMGIFTIIENSILFGLAAVGIAIWLFLFDIAKKTVRKNGLARYSAFCLLSGYVWLLVFGVFTVLSTDLRPGPHYDSVLHSFFLGFIFLMIFGHAPIIFPSILGVSSVYNPIFYVHFVLLNLSLATRIYGNVTKNLEIKTIGGIGNSVSLLFFLLLTMPFVLKQVFKTKKI